MATGLGPKVIVDADGHLDEEPEEIIALLDPPMNSSYVGRTHGLFPKAISFENRARGMLNGVRVADYRLDPTADKWLNFANKAHVEQTVLYPTAGLGIGAVGDGRVADILARGYNNWAFEKYTKFDERLKCVALLPMQDPQAAIRELERVKALGMPGAVLPAFQFAQSLGSKDYWPVYEAAEANDFALGIHGTGFVRGAELIANFKRKGLVVHPFCQMGEFASMMTEGVFEAFPKLKVLYLEAGSGWILYMMDRLDEWWRGETGRSPLKKRPSDYVREGNIYVSAENYEETLPEVIARIGSEHIVCATDFPHEQNEEERLESLEHWHHLEGVSDEDLANILANTCRKAYSLPEIANLPFAASV